MIDHLAEEDVAELERRLKHRERNVGRSVWTPDELAAIQAAKHREANAASKAEQERLRAEREAAEGERQRLYRENAPKRDAALTELEQLEPALAVARESCRDLAARRRELMAEIDRWSA